MSLSLRGRERFCMTIVGEAQAASRSPAAACVHVNLDTTETFGKKRRTPTTRPPRSCWSSAKTRGNDHPRPPSNWWCPSRRRPGFHFSFPTPRSEKVGNEKWNDPYKPSNWWFPGRKVPHSSFRLDDGTFAISRATPVLCHGGPGRIIRGRRAGAKKGRGCKSLFFPQHGYGVHFHLVKNMFPYFPLLVLKGIYHYWKYFSSSRGLEQMEVHGYVRSLWVAYKIGSVFSSYMPELHGTLEALLQCSVVHVHGDGFSN